MNPRPDEIYLARHVWRRCPDPRPWLVIDVRGALFGCMPIATEDYGDRDVFRLDSARPEFKATGLTKSCHIFYEAVYDLEPSSFMRLRGILQGGMRLDFRKAAGFP